jgi:hypothetical protein
MTPEQSAGDALARVVAERDALRGLLDEATRLMLNLGTRPAEINAARRIRKQAGMEP